MESAGVIVVTKDELVAKKIDYEYVQLVDKNMHSAIRFGRGLYNHHQFLPTTILELTKQLDGMCDLSFVQNS